MLHFPSGNLLVLTASFLLGLGIDGLIHCYGLHIVARGILPTAPIPNLFLRYNVVNFCNKLPQKNDKIIKKAKRKRAEKMTLIFKTLQFPFPFSLLQLKLSLWAKKNISCVTIQCSVGNFNFLQFNTE